MDKKEIASFSIEQMREIASYEFADVVYDGCVIALRKSNEIPNTIVDVLRYPCRVDAFLMILATNGEAEISCNLNKYEVKKNTVFIKTPNDIIQVHSLTGLDCIAVAYDENFMHKLQVDFRSMVALFLRIQECPCIALTQQESDDLQQVIAATVREIGKPGQGPYYDEVIRCLIRCGLYKMCNVISNYVDGHPAPAVSAKSRNEAYFQRFMEALAQHYKSERSVGFYASQLCITPKYLTTLIKRVSGRSAAEWIDEYVVLEAKNLLRYSSMSIQEVAYHLNFSNQSFFGKYFKHHTGISPSAYKMQK